MLLKSAFLHTQKLLYKKMETISLSLTKRWVFICKLFLRNISSPFYIKIKKLSLFSCRAGVGVCIDIAFMSIACFVQKLSRLKFVCFHYRKRSHPDRAKMNPKNTTYQTCSDP